MFYQEALPKCWFVCCVVSLLAIGARHWRKLAATFEKKGRISKCTSVCAARGAFFMWGAYFCIGAYKRDVVVANMGAYIMGCLFSMSAYYPDFTVEIPRLHDCS